MKNLRSSNFELLRIFAMFFIVMFHLYMHSFNGTLPLSDFSINKIIAATLAHGI